MADLWHRHKILISALVGIFILAIIIIYNNIQDQTSKQELDTPGLIQLAFDRGEITEEERLLYLAYALYEHESLPSRFVSYEGWFGEMYAWELQEAVTPEKVCSMSPHVRSEFQRLFELDATCEKETWTSILVGILAIASITFVVNIQNRKSKNL